MFNRQTTREDREFKFIDPLDESLLRELNVPSDMPEAGIINLIREHLYCRSNRCALCGAVHHRRELTVGRRRPESHGGEDNIKNLQLLCRRCSALKGDGTMLHVRKRLRAEKLKRRMSDD